MIKAEKKISLSGFLTLDGWRSFFMGRAYPALIATLVLFGNITALDYYVNFIVTGLFVFAMMISKSIRPLIITACSYIYQISVAHAPGYPTYSDFFFSAWRKPVSVFIIFLVGIAFVTFAFRNGIHRRVTEEKGNLFSSLLFFSIALLFNGAFSGEWSYKNLIFGFLNTLVYFFLFLIVCFGFEEHEKSNDILEYFCYISLLLSGVIICEMLHLFLLTDGVIVGGAIVKDRVALGWGIWNIIGNSLAVLIPALFYGAMTARRYYIYFLFATLSYIFSVLSMSRNALVFSSLCYFVCIAIASFFGNHRIFYRRISIMGILLILIFGIVFFGEIRLIFIDYFERGFSDSGRFQLWSLAIGTFRESPVFGNGFYGLDTDLIFEYSAFPRMAHNTFFQILSSMGFFGIISYGWYRIETARIFLNRPTLPKTMLGMSILVFLLGSLLDNFVFNIHPAIYYTFALAIAFRLDKEENKYIKRESYHNA